MKTKCCNCYREFDYIEYHKDQIEVCSECWNKIAHGEPMKGLKYLSGQKTIRYVENVGMVICYDPGEWRI